MTRARDVADTQENLGGGVPPFVAGKNAIINGAFNIWQRGTSYSVSANSSPFVIDRWRLATDYNATVSRQATSDTTNLPNIQYCARVQRNSGQTGTYAYLMQYNETANSIFLAGKFVTFSFYARAGANYSASSNTLTAQIITGTGTDQNLWAGYTGQTTALTKAVTLTTTWQRFTATTTLASNTTEIGYWFNAISTGTAGANDYFEVTGVQLEAGNVATSFTTASGSIAGELALCQRYYQKSYPIDVAPGAYFPGGYSLAIIQSNVPDGVYYNYQRLITRMRVAPTVVIYSGAGTLNKMTTVAGGDLANSSALTNSISDMGFGITNNSGTTLTFSSGGYLFYYTASAEL